MRSPRKRQRYWAALLAGVVLAWTAPARGHNVTVFAWVENGTIHTESKFSADKPVLNGRIEVYDPQGRKLLEGTTDAKGRFAFRAPQLSDLKIVLRAGMGHGNHWWVRADEISPGQGADQIPSAPAQSPEGRQAVPADGSCLEADAVRQIVLQAVEAKLAPLEARLAQRRWHWRDVLGGIGYILGLAGVAVLVRDRMKKRTVEQP